MEKRRRAVYAGAASSRLISSSSFSSCRPCPTASSSPAANSIRPLPSWHSSSVSRRPAWFESSRRMISSSRSTAPSYVIASALIVFLRMSVSSEYLCLDAAVGQPRAEAPRRTHGGRPREQLAALVEENCIAALERALGVECPQRRGARLERLRAAFLECLARAVEARGGRGQPHRALVDADARALDRRRLHAHGG